MKANKLTAIASLTLALVSHTTQAQESKSKWSLDVSLYGLAAGMSGEAGLGPVDADLDVDFDEVWDNLKFGAMGTVRLGYDRWAVSTDVIYMELESTKDRFSAEVTQWMVQPQLEYQVCEYFGLYAGARYNSIDMELSGPLGINPSDVENWWDPVVGARVRVPLGAKFSFNVSGDVGGFGVNSDIAWQAFPYFSWEFAKWGSLQAGYRWLYIDYETGSGLDRFKYEFLTHGPQIGFTLHF